MALGVIGLAALAACDRGAPRASERIAERAPVAENRPRVVEEPSQANPTPVAQTAATSAPPPPLAMPTADPALGGIGWGSGGGGRREGASERAPRPRPTHGVTNRGAVAAIDGFQVPAPAGRVLAPAPAMRRGLEAGPSADITLPTIDPNGRFATTYRPGRGHLAGFEASLARGEVPPESRELVGDVGSRYAPNLAAPTERALAWQVDLARAALPPSGGHTHLRIALRSSAQPATTRPPMSVHVVFDVSNSMAGDSIVNARRAAQTLVERLEPGDHFSLVAFGGTAAVRVPEGPVGPRRQQVLDAIGALQLEGGTNISDGLALGYAEVAKGPQSPEWVRLVMLLSDGRPNAGETRAEALAGSAAQAFQTGVQTSTFGVGDDYDGNLMAGIADRGAGGYYYVRDSQGIARALTTELESRLQPVAQAVEVRVRLRPDVRLTQTYGSRRLDANETADVRAQELAVDAHTARRDRIGRDRQNDVDGGMRFFIPGFARDDSHVFLLGVDLPAGVGQRPLATIELRYKDRLTRRNVTDEIPLRVRYADSDAASAAMADPSVARTVQGFDAGETLTRAGRLVGAGDRDTATALLTERAQLLRAAAEALHEPRLAADGQRLDRMRALIAPGAANTTGPLALAMLLNTSGQGMLR